MIGILCALKCEAHPFIRHFGLKKTLTIRSMNIYANDGVVLIVSGTGIVRVTAATVLMCERYGTENLILLNIGICGANKTLIEKIDIGTPILMNKITNDFSQRDFYPEMLIKHSFIEGTLKTIGKPANENIEITSDVFIDMEGAGFFESASIFLPLHHIFCLKILSDFQNPNSVSIEFVEELIQGNIPKIEKFMMCAKTAFSEHNKQNKEYLSKEDKELIEKVSHCLRLTVSQKHQLNQLIIYRLSCGKSLTVLDEFLEFEIKNPVERRKVYALLTKTLSN